MAFKIKRTLDENSGHWDPEFSFWVRGVVVPYTPYTPAFTFLGVKDEIMKLQVLNNETDSDE
jgi:hypothetical protein